MGPDFKKSFSYTIKNKKKTHIWEHLWFLLLAQTILYINKKNNKSIRISFSHRFIQEYVIYISWEILITFRGKNMFKKTLFVIFVLIILFRIEYVCTWIRSFVITSLRFVFLWSCCMIIFYIIYKIGTVLVSFKIKKKDISIGCNIYCIVFSWILSLVINELNYWDKFKIFLMIIF